MGQSSEQPPLGFANLGETFVGRPWTQTNRLLAGHRPWRKTRFLAQDMGIDAIEAWRTIKAYRRTLWRELSLTCWEGGRFGFCVVPELQRSLFLIDRTTGDDLLRSGPAAIEPSPLRKRLAALFRSGEAIPQRMHARTMMDEAAESSIMEGASSTREQAVEMLREGRAPRTVGERMIANNYQAMLFVKRSLARALSIEMLMELHAILTEKTLTDAHACGRPRTAAEPVRVVDTRDDSTIFVPPPAEAIPRLLRELCEFANTPEPEDRFIHPIVKACVLHFMIGYIHPFLDGNGRTARAVFYWHALRTGYGLFEYLSISEIIAQGFARYPGAYLDCERDDGDLTYFVLYKLDVIEQALHQLAAHLHRIEQSLRRSEGLLALSADLNLRQRLLLEHALRHPTTQYTVKSHMNSNGITPVTARTDLQGLVAKRLMTTTKRGKEVLYLIRPSVARRLAKKTAR